MTKHKHNFTTVKVSNSKQLETIIEENIDGKNNSYYLILNEWDSPSDYFWKRLPHAFHSGSVDLNVINIFNVPNVLDLMRSCIKSHKETISTTCLSSFDQLPMLVVMHKAFPRVVTYNGSISAELGI